MTARPVPLPTRRSKTAPRFNVDDPFSLWEYFMDFEALAEAAQLDDVRKIKHSVIYLDRDEAEFWKSLNMYSGSNWQAFKNAVLERYPGSTPDDRWTLDDFSSLCNAQKTKSVQTRGDFAEFDRKFSTMSEFLVNNGLLSDLETKKCYWSSLDPDFRHLVAERVKFSKPAYTSRMILTIPEIYDAASLVLDGTPAEKSSVALQNTTLSTLAPSVQPEPFSMDRFAQQMAVMMAQTVEKAISKAFDQATSVYTPPMPMNNSQNNVGVVYPSHTNDITPVYPRNVPWEQEEDNNYDCVSKMATVASSNMNTIGMSTNLVEVGSVQPVETNVESKRDRNAYLAALQWKISQRVEEDDDDEELEDLILGLEARVEKPKKTDENLHQGPQEEQTAPTFAVPRIPARAIVPPKSAPVFGPCIFEVADQPYHVPVHREVIAEPVEIPDHVLSRNVTLSVEDFLTLCPGARKQLEETVITQQMAMKSLKKDLEKEEMMPRRAALLVEENSCLGTVVTRRLEEQITPSEPKEVSFEESIEKEVATEMINLKKSSEEMSHEEELSPRRIDCELFEEGYCPFLCPKVIAPSRNKKSSMYWNTPPVESLQALISAMYPFAPHVLACRSVIANHCRVVPVKFSIGRANQEDQEMKKSRTRALKKIEWLPYDPGGKGLVQFETSKIAIPACSPPTKLPNERKPVCARSPYSTLSSKSQNRNVFLVVILASLAALQPVKEAPTLSVSVFTQEQEMMYHRKPVPIPSSSSFNFQCFILNLYPSSRHRVKLNDIWNGGRSPETKTSRLRMLKEIAPLPLKSKHREPAQCEVFRIDVSARVYLVKRSIEERLWWARIRDLTPSFKLDNPPISFVKSSATFAATSPANKHPTSNAAVKHKKTANREKNVLVVAPTEMSSIYRWTKRKNGQERKRRRRRKQRSLARKAFVEGGRPGGNGYRRSCKERLWECDVGWEERCLGHKHNVEIEPNGETKHRYPEPRFEGWRKESVSQRKKTTPSVVFASKCSATYHSRRNSRRSSVFPERFYSYTQENQTVQTRLKGSREPIQMPHKVESREPRLVGDLQVKTEFNVETTSLPMGTIVTIRKTKSGVWIVAGTVSLVAVFRCRPYHALPLDTQSIAKIVGAEEDVEAV